MYPSPQFPSYKNYGKQGARGKPILTHAYLPNAPKHKTFFYVCSLRVARENVIAELQKKYIKI